MKSNLNALCMLATSILLVAALCAGDTLFVDNGGYKLYRLEGGRYRAEFYAPPSESLDNPKYFASYYSIYKNYSGISWGYNKCITPYVGYYEDFDPYSYNETFREVLQWNTADLPTGIEIYKSKAVFTNESGFSDNYDVSVNELMLNINDQNNSYSTLWNYNGQNYHTFTINQSSTGLEFEALGVDDPINMAYAQQLSQHSARIGMMLISNSEDINIYSKITPFVLHLFVNDIQPPTVSVIYPSYGNVLYEGNSEVIGWNANDNMPEGVEHFVIEITYDNEASWITLASNVPGAQRTLNWRVPCVNAIDLCKIKITAYDYAGLSTTTKSGRFTIRMKERFMPKNKWLTEYNGNDPLRGLQMLDLYNGWAVGENGLVLRKLNGEWSAVAIANLSGYDLNAVFFLKGNPQYGWIVGQKRDDPDKYQGIIIGTTDGGNTWPVALTHTFLGTPCRDVSFANQQRGYISCGNGIILKTTNGGASWEPTLTKPIPDPEGTSIWYNSIYTPENDPNKIRVSGDASGVLVESYDGGNAWGQPTISALPDNYYTWPPNTEFNKQLALLPSNVANHAWDRFFTPYNHGYLYENGAFQQISNRDTWFTNGYVILPDDRHFVSGYDGTTLWKSYLTGGWQNHYLALDNNIDVKAVSYLEGFFLDEIYLGCENGCIYNDNLNFIGDIVSHGVFLGPKSVEIRWGPFTGEPNCDRYDIYRSTSKIGPVIYIGFTTSPISYNPAVYSYIDNTAFDDIDYHYWIVSRKYGGKAFWNYWIKARPTAGNSVPPPPAPPRLLTATDAPDDNGEAVSLNWAGTPSIMYYIGRYEYPDYKPVGYTYGTNFIDNTVKNGIQYTYVVQSVGENYQVSNFCTPATGVAFDNLNPNQLAEPTGYYDNSSKTISIAWQELTTEPNLGGYWVCPEPLGKFASELPPSGVPDAYHVEHSSPIDRTIYKYRVPDSYIGHTLGFAVTAMDRSGNIGTWSPTVNINTNVSVQSTSPQATAYNNGRKLLYDKDGNLHLTYNRGDSITYQKSWDDGYSWTKGECIGVGNYPCLAKDSKGGICAAWVNGTNIEYSYRQSPWSPPDTLPMPMPVMNASSPALAVGKGDTMFLTYIQYSWLPQGEGTLMCLRFPSDKFDSAYIAVDTLAVNAASGSPTIAVDSKNSVHVAWLFNGDIYWTQRNSLGGWRAAANITNSSGVLSQNPSLANYGDVHLVWQEGNDICHRKGNWGPASMDKGILPLEHFNWSGVENVSQSPATPSLWPVYDGGYVAWSEEITEGITEAYCAHYSDFLWKQIPEFSKNPTQPSNHPQIAYRQNTDGNRMVTVWTEGTGPLYSLIARDTAGQVTPTYSAILGGEEPGIYTIERDGYLTFDNGISVDYDSTELQYYLPSLDASQDTKIDLVFYQPSAKANIQNMVYINDIPLGVVNIPAGEVYTFSKKIPPAAMKDGDGILRIENKKGVYAACARWQLIAYDKATGRGGGKSGGQAELGGEKPITYRYELLQNAPNPFSKMTAFRYQLANPCKTSLKVYNTLGQVVKTVVDRDQQPGIYNINWDGRDMAGRNVAAGVYFYRLTAGEFEGIKKMVVLR